MLSEAPAVLIANTETTLGISIASRLVSAGVPALLAIPSPLPVPPSCSTTTLNWDDPTSIPQVFDTRHSIQTVVLGMPASAQDEVLAGMRRFVDLAKAEGVERFILVGDGGSATEDISSYLEESGVSFKVLGMRSADNTQDIRTVLQTALYSLFSGTAQPLPYGEESV
ncbi:hypothetical protein FA13DRAFT_1742615 [Coprinellus micaceus]|uniref:Uncharacterized protein n=1 Tax=Coprinellus micaceus TaxID=71717 RepID=A0A4Y7SGK1_COPMI|nr:hypothetical protein FA13DRAFT_1742615 [Coprinellus micaceus]